MFFMDMIQLKSLEGQPGLVHGIFTRRSGMSSPPFDSLNVGLSTGDDPDDVRENRRRIARHLGFETSLYLHQVHGTEVAVVKKPPDPAVHLMADGAVTNIAGLLVVIQVADCQAVVMYDPVKKVVANVHSGWRGSAGNIIGRGVTVMTDRFGCDPKDIRAGIGPSLGPCCAEFIHYETELPRSFLPYRQGRHHFDFWRISRDQLQEKGIAPHHIETADICTRCRADRFFSHRHERPTGRFAVAAGLLPH